MAQKGSQLHQGKYSCSICLNLFKDPVTIPCGHSYCMNCIKSHWDVEDLKQINSCPQCRQTFTPRPVLVKNTMLADLLEELEKTGLQDAPAVLSHNLQENICSLHDEVKKMFCRTDQKCICFLCSVEDHKGHDTVSAAAERTERQRELEGRLQNIHKRIQVREKEVKVLQQEVEAINHSADKAVEDSDKMLTELIRLMEKRRSDVKQQLRSQQQTEVRRVLELQEKLEQEITELKRKDAELNKLSHTEDHNHFLHNFPPVSEPSEDTHSSNINIRPLRYFEDVTTAVTEARDKLQDVLTQTWTNISWTVSQVDVLVSQPEPKTKTEFLRYSREITLDPNTAHTQLLLSEGNRKATLMSQQQSYSDHPDRFINLYQVLSRESLTGRCYWEVEWKGYAVYVAVAYKNISRTGDWAERRFGLNDKSWALRCDNNSSNFRYNKIKIPILGPQSSRIGVYLDHSAGILSFYSVSETMTLLHRVQTTFTQPLYAGIGFSWSWSVSYGDTAEFCKLK